MRLVAGKARRHRPRNRGGDDRRTTAAGARRGAHRHRRKTATADSACMNDLGQIKINWRPREIPLVPVAAAAVQEAARALARRLLEMDDESLAQLRGAVGPQFIIVMGDTKNLPWVNGI